MAIRFDLHRLRLLRELERRGTLSAVAQALSYTPSAISQQLTLLEKDVGVPLLEPHGRRVRLTAQAKILVAHTEAVLERLEQAEAEIAGSLGEAAGTVRLVAFQSAMLSLVPPALSWLSVRHPTLRLEVTQAEPDVALPALVRGDFDLVLDEVYPGFPQPKPAEIDRELLGADPIRLVTAAPAEPGVSGKKGLRAHWDARWVMELPGSPAREWVMATCRAAGFEPDIAFESNDVLVHARLVESGHAVAFLPDLMRLDLPPGVHAQQLSSSHQREIVSTCRRGAREHPAIRAVRGALRVALEETTRSTSAR
jgi:DNA-binding transcriptional LysR family regulator